LHEAVLDRAVDAPGDVVGLGREPLHFDPQARDAVDRLL
jgi:hypothetical protein